MYKLASEQEFEYDRESAVIIDLNNGEFFELNEVDNIILSGLIENKSIIEIQNEITAEYDIPEDTVLNDIKSFESQMIKKGVIVVQS